MQRLVSILLFVMFSPICWAASGHDAPSARALAGIVWSLEILGRLLSVLTEPERLAVVGLSLIVLSLLVRRRMASRRASR